MVKPTRKIKYLFLALAIGVAGCSSDPSNNQPNMEDRQKSDSSLAAQNDINLGMIYLQKGNTQNAQARFYEAQKKNPEDPSVWYAMGYFYEIMGENKKAEANYLKAIEVAPSNGNAKNNYGTFLCHTTRYQEGVNQFLAALETPGYINITSTYENIGLCAMNIPNYSLAASYLQKAVKQDPKRYSSLVALTVIYYKSKDYKSARYYLNKCKEVNPNLTNELLNIDTELKKIS